MNTPILGQKTCANCANVANHNGQMVCALNPPTSSAIVGYKAKTTACPDGTHETILQPFPAGFVAACPAVGKEMRCSHHKVPIFQASSLDALREKVG